MRADQPGDDEPALIRAAARGDVRAFGQLYDRYAPLVVRRLSHLVGPSGPVDDLVQETFLRAMKALPGFRHATTVSPPSIETAPATPLPSTDSIGDARNTPPPSSTEIAPARPLAASTTHRETRENRPRPRLTVPIAVPVHAASRVTPTIQRPDGERIVVPRPVKQPPLFNPEEWKRQRVEPRE